MENLPLTVRPLNSHTYEAYAGAAARRGRRVIITGEGVTVWLGDQFICGLTLDSGHGAYMVAEDLVGEVPVGLFGMRIMYAAVDRCLRAAVDYAVGRDKVVTAVIPMGRPALLRAARRAGFQVRAGVPLFAAPLRTEPAPLPKRKKKAPRKKRK